METISNGFERQSVSYGYKKDYRARARVTLGMTLVALMAGISSPTHAATSQLILPRVTISDAEGQKACNTANAVDTIFKDLEFIIRVVRPKNGPFTPVYLRVSTSDGTAKAGEDYEPITNKLLIIDANQSEITLTVRVKGGEDADLYVEENMFVNLTIEQIDFTPVIVDLVGEGTILDPQDVDDEFDVCNPHPDVPTFESPSTF